MRSCLRRARSILPRPKEVFPLRHFSKYNVNNMNSITPIVEHGRYPKEDRRVLDVLMYNQPGCLAEITNELYEMDLRLHSVSLSPDDIPELCKMSCVVYCDDKRSQQIKRTVGELVSVRYAEVFTTSDGPNNFAEVSQLLVKVCLHKSRAGGYGEDPKLSQLVALHGASVVDISGQNAILRLTAQPFHIDAFLALLKACQLTILEVHRSGSLVLPYFNALSTSSCNSAMVQAMQAEKQRRLASSSFRRAGGSAELIPTSDLYRDNVRGQYTKSRRVLHRNVLTHFLSAAPKNQEKATLVILIGPPGSGKDTIVPYLPVLAPPRDLRSLVRINVDDCMALLPDFTASVLESGLGGQWSQSLNTVKASRQSGEQAQTQACCEFRPLDPDAGDAVGARGVHDAIGMALDAHTRYSLCRKEAKYLCSLIQSQALSDRQSIVFHGTGKDIDRYRNILLLHRAAGYEVHLVGIHVAPDAAISRVKLRAREHGRDVPEEVVRKSVQRLVQNFAPLAELADNAMLFDSTGNNRPANLLWTKEGGRVTVLRERSHVVQRYGLAASPTAGKRPHGWV